ncbi:MAG: sigma-70 family RNA polymerase sigma factor [Planctomycetota bacterium]
MAGPDRELLERATEGDAAALRTLLERYGPQAQRAIHGKIGPRWRAMLDEDDVMQVAFLEAFLHIDQLVARDPAAFAAWLTRTAENILRDTLRALECRKRASPRALRRPQAEEDSHVALLAALGHTSTTPSRDAARTEAAGILNGMLRRLPADYRTVVQQVDLEGSPVAAVAAAMGALGRRGAHAPAARPPPPARAAGLGIEVLQ